MQVGVVVPAFNEGPRVGKVLDLLSGLSWLNRVVVVDDGSRDNTTPVAQSFDGSVLLQHNRNLGKGAALENGLARLKDMDAVLFLDADLVGLNESHLKALLEPINRNPKIGMVVGAFRRGRWHVDLQQKYFAVLNGQRALSRAFLDALPDLSWSRYGVEVLLSSFASRKAFPVAEAYLHGLTHVLKEEKFGLVSGFRLRLQMYQEVLRAKKRCRHLFSDCIPLNNS